MAANDRDVRIVLTVDGKQYEAELAKAGRGMRDFGNQGKASAAEISHLTGIMKGFAGVVSAGAVLSFGRALAQNTIEYERLNGQLVTLTGSQKAANEQFKVLERFAASTPFQLNEVVGAFSKLKALGLEPSEAALRSYGNTAVAMGKSLDQFIEAVADASTGEFERLKEFGIRASKQGDVVRFTFQGVTTEVRNSSEQIQTYLRDIGESKFGDAMAQQMNTLGGAVSNLKDQISGLAREVAEGSGFNSGLKNAANRLSELISAARQAEDVPLLKYLFFGGPLFGGAAYGVELRRQQNERNLGAFLDSSVYAPTGSYNFRAPLPGVAANDSTVLTGEALLTSGVAPLTDAQSQKLRGLQQELDLRRLNTEEAKALYQISQGSLKNEPELIKQLTLRLAREKDLETAREQARKDQEEEDKQSERRLQKLIDLQDRQLEKQEEARIKFEASGIRQRLFAGAPQTGDLIEDSRRASINGELQRYAAEQSVIEDAFADRLDAQDEYQVLAEASAQQHADNINRINAQSARDRAVIESEANKQGLLQIVGFGQDAVRFLEQFAGQSKGQRIALLAFEKALAIAEIIIQTQVAAAKAVGQLGPFGLPLSAFIEGVGAARVALVAATGIAEASNIKSGNREYGGSVSAGNLYEVGERNKPELYRYGDKTYLLPGNQGGTVVPARQAGSGSMGSAPTVKFINNGAPLVQTAAPQWDGQTLTMFVDTARAAVRRDVRGGTGLGADISATYGMQRKQQRKLA